MLGEIFNDPSATSLTKLNLEDSDSDNDDISGSGSELWTGSGELPKPSEDSSSVKTDNSQQKQQTEPSTQTETSGSGSDDKSSVNNSGDTKDNTGTTSSEKTDNTTDDTDTTPESTNSAIASAAAQSVPQQSSTNSSSTSSPVTSQGADAKLLSTEDQSQNSVVQNGENSKSSNDTSAPNADFFAAQPQNSLETFTDNPAAALVGQQAPAFDDNSLYDPTIVKKTDIPVASDSFLSPLGKFTQ